MPKFFKKLLKKVFQTLVRCIVWGTTALMTVFAVGVYAQALSVTVTVPAQTLADSQRLMTFDYCGALNQLLHTEGKAPKTQTLDLAVKACEVYMQVETMYCPEIKDAPLKSILSGLKDKSRTEYGLDKALKDLESLLQILESNRCKEKPIRVENPDPFGKR